MSDMYFDIADGFISSSIIIDRVLSYESRAGLKSFTLKLYC